MTPSELKSKVDGSSYFFSKATMRFFGDTMRNYGVRTATVLTHWDEAGSVYSETPHPVETWELFRKNPVKHGLDNSTYFDKKTFRKICQVTP